MRRIPAGLLVMALFAVSACGRPEQRLDAPSGKAQAVVKASCSEDGFTFVMRNSRLEVESFAEWRSVGSDVDMEIVPANEQEWPFVGRPPRLPRDGVARSDSLRPGLKRGTVVKYNIRFICNTGAPGDTVVIDPDIIIIRDT